MRLFVNIIICIPTIDYLAQLTKHAKNISEIQLLGEIAENVFVKKFNDLFKSK